MLFAMGVPRSYVLPSDAGRVHECVDLAASADG